MAQDRLVRTGYDVAIVGGGIVGLATAYQLLQRAPDCRLVLLEKEGRLAAHQTGHNSGVLHSGLYYRPGSLKARLTREGKSALEAFAAAHGIPCERSGKLVVASTTAELAGLDELLARGTANGLAGLEQVGPERIREIEPHVVGLRGLWVPETGIIDFRQVAGAMATDIEERGGVIRTNWEVAAIRPLGTRGWLLRGGPDDVRAEALITCAGLHADRLAGLTGHRSAARIVPFRGDYYRLQGDARALIRGLVYPVPDPAFPFLGVHFTRRIDGEVWAGPNAVLAFAREGYRRTDVSPRDLAGSLGYPGFWRLARPYLRTGLAEMWRDLSRGAFLASLRRYVPELRAKDLRFGPSGVRAQALGRDGTLLDDFALEEGPRLLHVVNAPSPAASASLAIGRMLAERAIERFELTGRPAG